jgi:hypothetical protein
MTVIRKKPAVVPGQPEGNSSNGKQAHKVEVVHVKTYVTPTGDAYYAGRSYTVTPEKRAELFKFKDEAGVPYFRDYDPARYKKPVKDTPENLHEAAGGGDGGTAAAAEAESGEIDTAQGVVRLPKKMRRSEKGVTV